MYDPLWEKPALVKSFNTKGVCVCVWLTWAGWLWSPAEALRQHLLAALSPVWEDPGRRWKRFSRHQELGRAELPGKQGCVGTWVRLLIWLCLHHFPELNWSDCCNFCDTVALSWVKIQNVCGFGYQALTGTRYPTLPGLLFYYPYPTRNFLENFRVQGSYYTCCFSLRLYQWCQPLNSWRKGFSKDCKHFHICPFTRFWNMYKMDMALVLFVQKVKTEWAGIKYQ